MIRTSLEEARAIAHRAFEARGGGLELAAQRERAQVVGGQREGPLDLGGAFVGLVDLEEHARQRVVEQRGVAVRGDRALRFRARFAEATGEAQHEHALRGELRPIARALRGQVELRQRFRVPATRAQRAREQASCLPPCLLYTSPSPRDS